jgi:protein-disulfide isomerase
MHGRPFAFLFAIGIMGFGASVFAAADGSQLELPKGANVVIIVIESLEFPDCAAAHPDLVEIARTNKVPLVVHDYPTARDTWAFPAAILVRYFDTLSPPLGADFRSYVFQYQARITANNLRSAAERFAVDHKLILPPEVDADGRLKAQVQADVDVGRRIRLEYAPSIFVVGQGKGAAHFVEVSDLRTMGDVIAKMKQ